MVTGGQWVKLNSVLVALFNTGNYKVRLGIVSKILQGGLTSDPPRTNWAWEPGFSDKPWSTQVNDEHANDRIKSEPGNRVGNERFALTLKQGNSGLTLWRAEKSGRERSSKSKQKRK